MHFRPRFKHIAAASMALLAILGVGSSPLFVHQARAQITIVENVPQKTQSVLDTILQQLAQAAVTAFFNAARQFAGQIAYDAANFIASGGKGQAALVFEDGFGKYLENVAGDTAGEFIGSLSNNTFFQTIGIDLCAPPNPSSLLDLQFSLGNQSSIGGGLTNIPGLDPNAQRPGRPRCDFQDIVQNYEQLAATLTNEDVLSNVNFSIRNDTSDIGLSATILGRSTDAIAKKVAGKKLERLEGEGFKAVEQGKVSEKIGTPASLVKEQTTEKLVKEPAQSQSDAFLATMGTAFEQGFASLAQYTASLFINTLTNKMMERIMSRGIVGAFDFSDLDAQRQASSPDAVIRRNQTDTRRANIDLKQVNLLRVSDVEIVGEMIACPDNRGLWNCTADQSLASAIQPKGTQGGITIASALRDGFLKSDWELVPVADARRNQDRRCYTYAYCAGNLAKLRAMRILPVGLEFAANSQQNIDRCTTGRCVTLGEVVEGFTRCNADGNRDADNPWCRLVDPNWVITSFQQQCQLAGYSDTLASERFSQRRQECRDIQTCLRRNDKGECVGGFGYCVAEKTVYRFNADECPAHFASCQSYTSRQGRNESYLRSTIDYGVCSASNIGCLGYATTRDSAGNWTSARTYFDSTIQPCSASDEGCTKLYAAEVGGSSLNYIQNPSFEIVAGSPARLENWSVPGVGAFLPPLVTEGTAGFDGASSYETVASAATQTIPMNGGRLLTLSIYVRAKTAGASSFTTVLNQYTSTDGSGAAISTAVTGPLFRSNGCTATELLPHMTATGLGSTWQRFECSFLSAPGTRSATLSISGSNTLLDAVQVEESEFATAYINGANTVLPVVHMKMPPDDLGCDENSTSTACGRFAKICRQVDASCQGYTDRNGGPEIPAILSSNDLCPQECVGYAEYRKQASSFDLVADPDPRFSDPADLGTAYFIPSTASICRQEDVGCETFTNIEASTAGGEQSLSLSYLRSCRKPDAARTRTFFTWEGSESSGYQLRTFSLIASAAPLTVELGETVIGPDLALKRGPDGQYKDPVSCNPALWRTGVDPDCRQYYDRDGNVFYRYESQTILSSDECTQLRIARRSNRADCENTDGDFNETTGECTYNAVIPQSRVCQAPAAGCKGFAGSGAGNILLSVNQNFRDGRGTFSAGEISTESLLVGDSSLRLFSAAANTEVSYISRPQGLYRVSFWAKAPGPSGLSIALSVRNPSLAAPAVAVGNATLGADWQQYTIGLWNGPEGATSTLRFTVAGALGGRSVFIDEVRIEEIRDTVYAVDNSWTTPAICDRSFAGTPEPQAMLGCRAYRDRLGNNVNAFRFTRLCRDEAIGCRAFVDTRNSDASGPQTFGLNDSVPVPVNNGPAIYPGTTTTRLGDRMVYAIYDRTKLCRPENASCRAFGKPVYTNDRRAVETYEIVYLKDDITKYGEGLCRPSEEFCEEFTGVGGKDYFRNPDKKVCEYRESQRLTVADFDDRPDILTILGGGDPENFEERDYSGWFEKESNIPCYPEILQNGNNFALPLRGDATYTGWYGTCPSNMNSCTEFRDPNDTTDPLYATGRPYYFLNNDRIDKESCQGNIDEANGCILMREMSNPIVTYNVAASYAKYRDQGLRPTSPVDCLRNPTDPYCETVGATDNTANLLIKVNIDRDCSQWLGCKSAETVFDSATREYKDICVNLALCDKASGKPEDIFCSNYVDRTSTTTAGILTSGTFFDADVYASREVGLGQRDYSGYALPDAYQIVDTRSVRVAAEGAKGVVPDAPFRLGLDYRLAAALPMRVALRTDLLLGIQYCGTPVGYTPAAGEAIPLDNTEIARTNPNLSLCQDPATGNIGFFVREQCSLAAARTINCYLPVRSPSDNSDFQNLADKFSLEDPRLDVTLTEAYPPAECRANPEADSPFGTKYVSSWEFSENPPKPTKVAGFTNANTCEYGEDCVCSYKRADYGSIKSKFFGPDSQAVPAGICIGGPRDGQSCLPSSILDVSVSGGTGSSQLGQGVTAANAALGCGPEIGGGRCVAFNKLEVVRGIFGQCLERDSTRFLGVDQTDRACLTFNPNPILFGSKDPYHWQPTSGYQPPQNAGQYYCVAPARNPTVLKLNFQHFKRYRGNTEVLNPSTVNEALTDWGRGVLHPETTAAATRSVDLDFDWRGAYDRQFFGTDYCANCTYVGRMSKMHFDEDWLGQDNRCAPNECEFFSTSIDGYSNFQTPNELACEAADGDGEGEIIEDALRLVDAGTGYRETFFRINTPEFVRSFGGYVDGETSDGDAADASVLAADVNSLMSENNIGYFQIDPITNGQEGRLACGYQAEWVDNVPQIDYANPSSRASAYSVWSDGLKRDYQPFLTRATEEVIQNADRPLTGPCVDDDTEVEGGEITGGDTCYFKTWETGYRDDDEQKFIGIYPDGATDSITQSLLAIRANPLRRTCDASRPYFSIRAVFQTLASNTPGAPSTISPSDVVGPWRFVGFWVSACSGNSEDDQRYMYFNIKVGAASVCRELAEVRSSGTNQDAAYTDRINPRSGYRDPATGMQYSVKNSPFSSALNTRVAGEDPLFQNGGELAGFDPLNPPGFLASGVRSYYQNNTIPRDKWAYLSNIFARVYRIYRFHDVAVTKSDRVCLAGPLKGVKCSVDGLGAPECQTDGVCDPRMLSAQDCTDIQVCNSQSGTSNGIVCSDNALVCRGPTLPSIGTGQVTVRNDCVAQGSWTVNPDNTMTHPTLGGGVPVSPQRARELDPGALGCNTDFGPNINKENTTTGDDSLIGARCLIPGDFSIDCPVRIDTATCDGVGASGFGTCNFSTVTGLSTYPSINLGAKRCRVAADCNFTNDNFNGIDDTQRGACTAQPDLAACRNGNIGRCNGGLMEGKLCNLTAAPDTGDSCTTPIPTAVCGPVSTGPTQTPVSQCAYPAGSALSESTSDDPDADNNLCTHAGGYYPRLDLCPNPSDEYCGLMVYNRTSTGAGGALDPASLIPLPTDVTIGHYTPSFFGFSGLTPDNFRYVSYYTPRPPQIAAPDTRTCAAPGQCPIARVNTFSFNGLAEGVINGGIGQSKGVIRFYAWGSHNQMPLRQVIVDWGDGNKTDIADTRLKNRKAFCGTQRECSNVPGLTCNTDSDCPPAAGRCVGTGTCEKSPFRTCSSDAECTIGGVEDRCAIRTMFGNTQEACEQGYFDFSHTYTCPTNAATDLPSCGTPAGRCSRDPNKTCTPGAPVETGTSAGATPGAGCSPGDVCLPAADIAPNNDPSTGQSGCFDALTNSCKFTPRVMVQDNWGWCTGECRGSVLGGTLADSNPYVPHPYGGCYAASPYAAPQTTRLNSPDTTRLDNECAITNPNISSQRTDHLRPWVVYPGSIQIRPVE
ncbi:hypothetical protein IT407_00145 [Candidatus Uhrbacteria bacterium]|nr:hypothetical protein [Candidatus Uhrbacteria bacterium]